MVVGVLRLALHIPEAHSLKERRMAVRRVVERLRARFNVSVAEVGDQSRWQLATVAVTTVSNDRSLVNEVLDRVTSQAASACAGYALITRRELELVSYGDDEPLGDGPPEAEKSARGGAGDDFDFTAWASGVGPALTDDARDAPAEASSKHEVSRALVDDEDDDG